MPLNCGITQPRFWTKLVWAIVWDSHCTKPHTTCTALMHTCCVNLCLACRINLLPFSAKFKEVLIMGNSLLYKLTATSFMKHVVEKFDLGSTNSMRRFGAWLRSCITYSIQGVQCTRCNLIHSSHLYNCMNASNNHWVKKCSPGIHSILTPS